MKRIFGEGEDYDEFKSSKKTAVAKAIAKSVEKTIAPIEKPAAVVLKTVVPIAKPPVAKPTLAKPAQDFLQDSERDSAFADIDVWLRKPGLPTSQRPLLLIGATGVGKTYVLEYYASSAGISLETYDYEFDLQDFLASSGLRSKGPGVLALEDLDAAQKAKVRSVVKETGSNASQGRTCRRLILTTCDEFGTSTLGWTKLCTTVRLERPKKFFMSQVLQAKYSTIDSEARSMLIEASGGNLAVALQSASSGLTCIADMPMDVPKATRTMLMGQTVKCLGGSSDTTYLSQLIEQNLPQCFGLKNIGHLARQLDHLSFLDICATTKEFEGEHLWTTLQSIAKTSQPASKFMFEWLKSTKPLERPKMDFVHGTCAHVME